MTRSPRKARADLSPPVGRLEAEGLHSGQAWGRQGWHRQRVQMFPATFAAYDDVPRLFRDHILPGHAPEKPILTDSDVVVTLGSCFAQELREVLEFAEFASSNFWIPAGLNNTYALLDFVSWSVTGAATHRGFRYERSADGDIVEWTPQHEQAAYNELFATAGAFVFTLGLAEVWADRSTGQVFWRGVPDEMFDADRHEFRLTTVAENERNIREIVDLVRTINPEAPVVLTLSPVPLQATFRDISCVTADCVSKSVLRVALDDFMSENPENVYYWPSFELVKWGGAVFDWRAYGADARHVHRYLVDCIVTAFVDSFYGPEAATVFTERLRELGHAHTPPHQVRSARRRIANIPASIGVPARRGTRSPAPARRPRRRPVLVLATAALFFAVFGLLPEALGDWPYNAFGKDSRAHTATSHHHKTAEDDQRPSLRISI